MKNKNNVVDVWWTDDYQFTKCRLDIDFVSVTRESDQKNFILKDETIIALLANDEGLDGLLSLRDEFGHFPLIELSENDIQEDHNRIKIGGALRRLYFGYASLPFFDEIKKIVDEKFSINSQEYQIACFQGLVYSGINGYYSMVGWDKSVTINEVREWLDEASYETIAKVGSIFRKAIKGNPVIGEWYGFKSIGG